MRRGTMDDPRDAEELGTPGGGTPTPVGPGHQPSTFDPRIVDFGHYAGQRIEDLAETDPAFLYWLARHPSGARYRAEIARVLGAKLSPPDD